jgi:hypothetical protein
MSATRVIVGFRKRMVDLDNLRGHASAEDKARVALTSTPPPGIPGFIRVLRRLKYLNAVIVEVERDDLDRFLGVAPTWDPVEYCDRNHPLCVASFGALLPKEYSPGTDLSDIVTRYHVVDPTWLSPNGLGLRVGIIDTGMSGHPYLPALSSAELKAKVSCFHDSIPRSQRDIVCSLLEQAEQRAGSIGVGLREVIPPQKKNKKATFGDNALRAEGEKLVEEYEEQVWKRWRSSATNWLANKGSAKKPSVPSFPNPIGAFRLLSPLSQSFLEGDLAQGISDFQGHGTQMAGILSALPPDEPQALPLGAALGQQSHTFAYNVRGLCPFAELVVLKCLHIEDEEDVDGINGSLVAVVDALGYCIDHEMDVVYIGLALRDGPFTLPMSVANLLHQLESAGTTIFGPTGNHGALGSGLGFPASSYSVQAVSGVAVDVNTNILSTPDYCAVPNGALRERVAFCAYSGTAHSPIVTTSPQAGFQGVFGTSVAAAIAAGCYTAAASGVYSRALTKEYDLRVPDSGQVSLGDTEQAIRQWVIEDARRTSIITSLAKSATKSQLLQTSSQTNRAYGAGMIQVPDQMYLP